MNRYNTPLTAIALAAAALLSACGGGGTTADTTPPTVTISDNMPGTATGDVTFTFTFSEAVTGFTSDDITVTNGTKGAFTMATNGLSATLVVTPPSTGSGYVEVAVAAGKFNDAANNANTAAASGSQAFGTAAPAAYLSFDEDPATFSAMGAYGGALPDVVTAPSGGSGKALKIVKPAGVGNEVWGGTYFTVPRVPFTTTQKAITARVYSTVANSVVMLKVEKPNGSSNPCTECTEVAGTTVTQANTWTTVTWNFSAAVLTRDHTVLAITPDPTRALDGATYYIDDINVVDTPAVTPPDTTGLTIVNFDESTPATLDPFEGTSFAATTDGTNKVAQLTKPTSAFAWGGATFLSCPSGTVGKIPSIPFSSSNQTISVRVKAPRTGVTFSLEAKDANNPGNLVFAEATSTTTEWETLSFNFANKTFGTAIDPNQVYNMLSIFPNFSKSNEGSASAETANSIYLIDDVKLVGSTATLAACPDAPVVTSPSAAAANPTAANLVALFSDASGYTAVANGTFRADWSSATYTAETVASNNVLKYSALDYVGIEPANPIDISTATHVNMDIWTPDLTKFRVKLVNFLNGTYNVDTNKEHEITLTLDDTQRSTWYRVRIPMADFTGLTERTHVKQLVLSVGDGVKGTVYVDNIFFSSN